MYVIVGVKQFHLCRYENRKDVKLCISSRLVLWCVMRDVM